MRKIQLSFHTRYDYSALMLTFNMSRDAKVHRIQRRWLSVVLNTSAEFFFVRFAVSVRKYSFVALFNTSLIFQVKVSGRKWNICCRRKQKIIFLVNIVKESWIICIHELCIYLCDKSQQGKHQSNACNMFKVQNKDTRTV